MRNCTIRNRRILGFSVAAILLCASAASAEPVSIRAFLNGKIRGAQVEDQLTLIFPDFTVLLTGDTHLIPGFCMECSNGAMVPMTQSTGDFSGHSTAVRGFGNVDADVSGNLSFTGGTGTINISHDPFDSASFVSLVTWSGWLVISQPNRILFNGRLTGTGAGGWTYLNTGLGDTRLAGYSYILRGTAETPEPSSILLFASGAAWLAMRRRRQSATNGQAS